MSQVNSSLEACFKSNSLLNCTGAHLCLAPGAKRVRPLLTAYFANMLKIPLQEIIPLALASELIHSASLLHDDVVDSGDIRRGLPTVNTKWSNAVAVLSGNYLLSLAFGQLKGFRPEITEEVISVVTAMTHAAILELQMRETKDVTLENWGSMARGKTGSLFAFCGTSVASHAQNREAHQAFERCGHHIGQVFQLTDDLADLDEDIQNQEASYPRIIAASGQRNHLEACQEELAKQVALALESLGPWAQTAGGAQLKSWLERYLGDSKKE